MTSAASSHPRPPACFCHLQRGVPIYVYKISALTPATLSKLIPNDAKSTSSIAVVTLALIRFLLPFTSSIQHQDQQMQVISGTNSIVDVGGVGLSRFWGLRSHLQVASQVASANFPETVSSLSLTRIPKPSRSSAQRATLAPFADSTFLFTD